jgi:hypothetical protein
VLARRPARRNCAADATHAVRVAEHRRAEPAGDGGGVVGGDRDDLLVAGLLQCGVGRADHGSAGTDGLEQRVQQQRGHPLDTGRDRAGRATHDDGIALGEAEPAQIGDQALERDRRGGGLGREGPRCRRTGVCCW